VIHPGDITMINQFHTDRSVCTRQRDARIMTEDFWTGGTGSEEVSGLGPGGNCWELWSVVYRYTNDTDGSDYLGMSYDYLPSQGCAFF
jgi:hypothetical protein